MPVLKTTSPGLFTLAPKEVPSSRWPSFSTSVAATGASQGLEGPPSTPSMRDLRASRFRVRGRPLLQGSGGGGARGRRGGVGAAIVAPRALRREGAWFQTPAQYEEDAYR